MEEEKIRPSYDEIFMGWALSLSRRSTCHRKSVGCIVVSSDNHRVLSMGYNGSYRGGPNGCLSNELGNCGCLHSEVNALIKCDYHDPVDRILYVTMSPCVACAITIVNANVREVVYHEQYRLLDGLSILGAGGIPSRQFSL